MTSVFSTLIKKILTNFSHLNMPNRDKENEGVHLKFYECVFTRKFYRWNVINEDQNKCRNIIKDK